MSKRAEVLLFSLSSCPNPSPYGRRSVLQIAKACSRPEAVAVLKVVPFGLHRPKRGATQAVKLQGHYFSLFIHDLHVMIDLDLRSVLSQGSSRLLHAHERIRCLKYHRYFRSTSKTSASFPTPICLPTPVMTPRLTSVLMAR